jgi:hypothetical protein
MGMLDFLKFQPLVNQKEVIANKKKLTPQEQALLTFGGGQAVGFDQPQNPVSLFPSANAAPGTPNKSVTTGPAQPQGGFDLGGMLGGIAGGIGNALKDPALLSMAVGTGLGLASGQLSPIQSLGAGAQGAQGILNQQREDELALRNKMWQMQLAKAQGGQPTSIDDLIKQGQTLGYKGDDLTNYVQGIQSGKTFTGTRAGGFLLREQVPTFQ